MKILDNRGLTLLELVLVMSIMAIILPIIYSVFTSGIQTYQKIQIEGLLKDDADYTSSVILNELYSFPFDKVDACDDQSTCIVLTKNFQTKMIQQTLVDQTFYTLGKAEIATIEKRIELKELEKNGNIYKQFFIDDKPIDITSNFNQSTIKITNEYIEFHFYVSDLTNKHSLELISHYGY